MMTKQQVLAAIGNKFSAEFLPPVDKKGRALKKEKPERKVAWTMLDGNTMAGTVVSEFRGRLEVRRVDGGMVSIQEDLTHPATPDEILAACDFYRTLGR